MYLRLIAPPRTEPVTLEEAKLHLRVDGAEEDSLITALITAARQKAEEYTRRAFITQTWELAVDAAYGVLYLHRPPVQAVEAITVDGEVVAPENYVLVGPEALHVKVPLYAVNPGGVVIRYKAGYGDAASDVPQAIRQAILMLIAHLYEHRGDEAVELPLTVKTLLQPYRVMQL